MRFPVYVRMNGEAEEAIGIDDPQTIASGDSPLDAVVNFCQHQATSEIAEVACQAYESYGYEAKATRANNRWRIELLGDPPSVFFNLESL